jgi:hypothetical protein
MAVVANLSRVRVWPFVILGEVTEEKLKNTSPRGFNRTGRSGSLPGIQ